MNELPCNQLSIQRGATWRVAITAIAEDNTPFDFDDAGMTNSIKFHTEPQGDVVVEATTSIDDGALIGTIDALLTEALETGKLWLEVRSENAGGFVWIFTKGWVNVY